MQGASLVPGWTRVSIFLPVNTSPEIVAAQLVQNEIVSHYSGATTSVMRPHAFEGFWYDSQNNRIVQDLVSIITVDIPISFSNAASLDTELEIIKLIFIDEYQKAGSPQQEVWIVAYPLYRLP